jgi:hypothetical protein
MWVQEKDDKMVSQSREVMECMEIIAKLERDYELQLGEEISEEEMQKWKMFCHKHNIKGWEGFFCPDEGCYEFVLDNVDADDVVFDVGAGDLRLDVLMAQKVKKVYAVEVNPKVLGRALTVIGYDLPPNLIPICGNGFDLEVPSDVTTIVMLMRHRVHEIPFNKWVKVRRLITIERKGKRWVLRRYDGFVVVKEAIENDYKRTKRLEQRRF